MSLDEIFDAHLATITTDLERWLALFAPDAVVEFPYAVSIGTAARLEGRDALRDHFKDTVAKLDLGRFSFHDVRRYAGTDPSTGWFEVRGVAMKEGRAPYEQDYVMRMTVRNERIVHYVEYWNMVPILRLMGKLS